MLLPAGLILLGLKGGAQPMTPVLWLYMGCALVLGAIGYHAITTAMRTGEISVVAPFRYTRMAFALIIGITVFHERPDFWTLFGVSVTIAAGVYTFLRERRSSAV